MSVPADAARMVVLQPYVALGDTEPFQWLDTEVAAQLDVISRTLDLAQADSGGGPAHFTVFPEYSVPGIDGVKIIENRIDSAEWQNESVVIAGLHGLGKAEYRTLCEELDVTVAADNGHSDLAAHQWVNCCLIWVKNRDGDVQRWLQPKIRPAWPEQNVTCADMYLGSTVYAFECRFSNESPCRFAALICFDWVAVVGGTTVIDEVLQQLSDQTHGNTTSLNWVFVIQHNKAPNHYTFLNSTLKFLTDPNSYPLVDTRDAVVVHANTAISAKPSASKNGVGAFSACVFAPGAPLDDRGCRPTVCMQPTLIRQSETLKVCKDVVFREMGECIHMFQVRVPRFVVPDATDHALPIGDAQVFPTREHTDPRVGGAPIPAAVKWANDALDNIECLSTTALANCALQQVAVDTGAAVVSGIRSQGGTKIVSKVDWATSSYLRNGGRRENDRVKNVDVWDEHEFDAMKHVVHSATSLGLAYEVNVTDASFHCDIKHDASYTYVVAIRAETPEECRRHFDENVSKVQTDPVLVVARDRDNMKPTPEEYTKYYEVAGDAGPAFVDYQTLSELCRNADDSTTLRSSLDGILPKPPRII